MVNGREIPITRDGIGLMAIQPGCSGACTVDMYFDGGTELRVTLLLSLMTLIGCAVYFRPRRRSQSPIGPPSAR
jgi:hypothetical protein